MKWLRSLLLRWLGRVNAWLIEDGSHAPALPPPPSPPPSPFAAARQAEQVRRAALGLHWEWTTSAGAPPLWLRLFYDGHDVCVIGPFDAAPQDLTDDLVVAERALRDIGCFAPLPPVPTWPAGLGGFREGA